jgi:hypothetical protein
VHWVCAVFCPENSRVYRVSKVFEVLQRKGREAMTEFDKPVQRRTRGAYRVLYSKPEKIVVRCAPGDVLEFRQAGGGQSGC